MSGFLLREATREVLALEAGQVVSLTPPLGGTCPGGDSLWTAQFRFPFCVTSRPLRPRLPKALDTERTQAQTSFPTYPPSA
jgi:hypothetical protein